MADGDQVQAPDLGPIYDRAADQYSVDPNLLRALIETESHGDRNAVSEAGAQGPAQLMPRTAQSLGVTDPTDWNQAIPAAAQYLRQNYDTFQNPAQAIMAYHGGPDTKLWGPKTRDYLRKVSDAYGDVSANPFEFKRAQPQSDDSLNFDDLIPKGKGEKAKQLEINFDDLIPTRGALAVGATEAGQAAVSGLGETAKGMAELDKSRQFLRPYWDMVQASKSMTPEQRTEAEHQVMRDQRTGKISMAISLYVQRSILGLQGDIPDNFDDWAGKPPQETGLGQAGKHLKEFAQTAMPVSEAERKAHPYASGIGQTVGTIGPAALTAIAGSVAGVPEIGLPLAAGQMGLMSTAQQSEDARRSLGTPAPTEGMLKPGNIDLGTRPMARTPDGSFATVRSMSINQDGREVLIPTVSDDGKLLSNDDAIALYRKTGKNLGTFASPAAADQYAEALHQAQAKAYGPEGEAVAHKAGDLAFITGTGMGALPLGAIIRPVQRSAPGLVPWATAKLKQGLTAGVVGTTINEAQDWLGRQIAREYYDPKAEWSPDMVRLISSMVGMGLPGVLHPTIAPKAKPGAAPAAAQPRVEPQAPSTEAAAPAEERPLPPGPELGSVAELEHETEGDGTPQKPVKVQGEQDLAAARERVHPSPTTPQVEANNARLGHIRFDDMPGVEAAIETPKGGERYDRKNTIPNWQVPDFPADYGRFKGTKGADGDEVDGYFGTGKKNFVIDQMNPESGKFDEHKVMKGFDSEQAALDVYRRAFPDGSANERIGAVTPVSSPDLAAWLKSGKTTKPFADKLEPRAPRPPEGPATPQSIIGDIDAGRVEVDPQAIAARYGIGRDQAAQMMHAVYQRPDSPIQPRSAPSTNPAEWTWQRVPDDRREGRIRDIENWAHEEFGLDRSTYPSDAEFIDAAAQHQQQAIATRLQPIHEAAAQQGIELTESEALDVEHAVALGHNLHEAVIDAGERGAIQGEHALGSEAKGAEDIPHEWQQTVAPHPELAPPDGTEPPQPRRAPAGSERGAAEGSPAPGQEPGGGARGARPAQAEAKRVGELEGDRLAHERGDKAAGHPAQSFEAIEKAQRKVAFDDLIPKPADYGAKNTVFTKSAADAARERLRAKLGRLNAGFDPEMMLDGLTLAGYHVEAGARRFGDYAKAMVTDLGEAAKPYLTHWYKSVRDYPGFDGAGMDHDEAIKAHLDRVEPTLQEARPVDSNGNPIFKKGERVQIPADGGHLAGRHGEVADVHGITMQAIFGGSRSTSHHYTVKTDEGALSHSSKLEPETERPAKVVPDPVVDGVATHPQQLDSSIGYAARDAERSRAAAGRAIKPDRKAALRDAAAQSDRQAQKLRAILEDWKRKYPEEAKRQFPEKAAAEPPKTQAVEPPQQPKAGVEVRQNAEKNGVEIKFAARPDDATLGQLRAAGFRWSSAQKLWYARRSPATLEAAKRIGGGESETESSQKRSEPVSKTPAVDDAPRQTVDRLKPAERPDWTEIGKNRIGHTLYQDQRGVRSYIVNGTRHTEPIGMQPTRTGVEFNVDRGAHPDWALVESTPAAEANKAPGWFNDLTPWGRRQLAEAAGYPPTEAERLSKMAWHYLKPDDALRLGKAAANAKWNDENFEAVRAKEPGLTREEYERRRAAGKAFAAGFVGADKTPTGRVEQQANEQGARAEFDAAEGQSSAMPVTSAATADPPAPSPFKPGDTVRFKPGLAFTSMVDRPNGRTVTGVGSDGTTITLDGGMLTFARNIEAQPEEALQPQGASPTSKAESRDELQGTLPASDAAARAGDVPRTGQERPVGTARPGEEQRGARPAGATPGPGAQGRGRAAEESAGDAARGGNRDGSDARLPDAREPATPGAAARSPDAKVQGRNLSLAPGEVAEGRGPIQKAKDNLAAIALAKKILGEDRPATREEQVQLAKYVGWGGLSGAFRDGNGNFGRGFEDIGRQLKDGLTEAEYRTASRSTQYAHYTAENVIRSMWDAVRAMGFRGGSVFEPGMGVGHFAGMMPGDLAAKSRYEGVELDHLTAKIAKLIYPESGVRQADFTRTPIPENAFDLVIGNPPFSDTVIHADPKYSARNFMLHDYFFAKSIDSVRPGGLLGFVTSAGTMNKIDPAARRYLAERADFLGGVRLPSSAFKKNAGTEVTTDVLFFKKRGEPVAFVEPTNRPPAWTETVPRSLPGPEGTALSGNVNRYFSEHPEQVLGREGFFDKLYRGRYGVHAEEGQDLTALLGQAMDRLPKDVMEQPLTSEQRAVRDLEAPERKDGSFYLKDGDLWQYRNGAGQPVAKRGSGAPGLTVGDYERIRRLIPIRDALRDVFRGDLTEDGALSAEARQRLNQHYDAFLQKHGPINKVEIRRQRPSIISQEGARAEAREDARAAGQPWREGEFDPKPYANRPLAEGARARAEARSKAEAQGREFDEGSFEPDEMPDVIIEKRPNIDAFMTDPESYRLRAIEHFNDNTGQSSKKRIFYENILTREEEPVLKSAEDGVLWSLNKHGKLDLDAIAAKMGQDRDGVIEALGDKIFRVPGADGVYHASDEYLSGDVVDKLAIARTFADHDPAYRRNVEALERVQPKPLAPSEIAITIGMPWIPSDTIRGFVRDHIKMGDVETGHNKLLGGWTAEARVEGPNYAKWGTQAMSPYDILRAALNRVSPRVYREIRDAQGNKSREFDPVASQAAQDKVEAMRQAFRDYIEQSPERQQQLSQLYNEKYNRVVLRAYDGSYLTTPGVSADWKWRPHQQRVVARIVQSGNTYVAHAVGAGKTSEYIGAGMEMRRLGLIKKPGYVVPNHMLGQFAKEFYEQYPLAKIAIADERNFHTGTRKQFMANVAQDDLDGVVLTHSAFGMIPISHEFQEHLIREELDRVEEAMGGLDKTNDRITIKRLENQKEKLEQRLQGSMQGRKDATNTFEEMGLDFLFIDEAHEFRKLQFATRQSSLKGIDPDGSNRAWDLMTKLRYLEGRRPGRSGVLGSGTPITNTMGELYSISRFLQPQELERRGLGHFDSWASTFGDIKTSMEQTAEGTYQHVTRFARFVNMPELYKMVGGIMDIVTPSQLDQYVVRPKVEGGKRVFNLAPKSDALADYQQSLAERVAAIKARKRPPQKGDDILLSVIHDGRHAAIDMRYVDPTLPSDPDSKLNQMIAKVYQHWKDTADTQFYDPASNYTKPAFRGPATQMVFMNFGVGDSPNRLFSGYDWIKRELVRMGVPRDQIAFIRDYKTHVQKQKLFNDMNEGRVRIMIGSTQKMGTGVNAQRRLRYIHNEDPLWFPSDDEQRNGRGIRQGNFNPEIGIEDYSTKGTYDSTMWQLMGNKGRFIEQFFRGDPELRDMEDLGEASQYEQASAISTADERVIQLTDLKHQLDRAERRKTAFEREQFGLRHDRDYATKEITRLDAAEKTITADIAKRQDTQGDAFKMKVGDKEYEKRKDAVTAIDSAVARAAPGLRRDFDHVKIGELGGFPVVLQRFPAWGDKSSYGLGLERSDGDIMRIESQGAGVAGALQSAEYKLRNFEASLEAVRHSRERNRAAIKSIDQALVDKFSGGDEIKRLRDEAGRLEFAINLTSKYKELEAALTSEIRAKAKEQFADVPFETAIERYHAQDEQAGEVIRGLMGAFTKAFGREPDNYGLKAVYDMATGRRASQEPVAAAEKKISLMERVPGLYSALERSIADAKVVKASPAAWKGFIKNQKGVKSEEVDWSGVNEWLDKQPGPVTKERLLEQIRQNNVQVHEVKQGGTAPPEAIAPIREWIDQQRQRGMTEPMYQDLLSALDRAAKGDAGGLDVLQEQDVPIHLMEPIYHAVPGGAAKYGAYTLPGGKNYRELLLTMPQPEAPPSWTQAGAAPRFMSRHWNEPNVLAHVRFDDRVDADGKKVLHIAELQSDWHQKGRREGYQEKGAEPARVRLQRPVEAAIPAAREALKRNDYLGFDTLSEALEAVRTHDDWATRWEVAAEDHGAIDAYTNAFHAWQRAKEGVPSAPFKTTWHELAMKRMLRYAAEHGYDRLTWDTGATNADRFNIGKHVDGVTWEPETGDLYIRRKGEPKWDANPAAHDVTKDNLADHVGKEVAERLLAQPLKPSPGSLADAHVIEGENLRLGDQGMKGFYDKMLPAFVNRYAKKWGAKAGETTIQAGADENRLREAERTGDSAAIGEALGRPEKVHSVDITPEMRKGVMEGQPQFERQAPGNRVISDADRERMTAEVKRVLDKIAPGATVRRQEGLIEGIGAGRYDAESEDGIRHLITWSLQSPDVTGTARHEGLHYLRNSGLLTPAEWKTLATSAERNGLLSAYDIPTRYPDLPHDQQVEEAVAAHFQNWQRFRIGALTPIFQKIDRILGAIKAAVRRVLGKEATPEDIYRKIESGEVGARPQAQEPGEAIARDQREIPGTGPETPEQTAARQRQEQKQEAEARMRGRATAKKPQESAEDTPLFGGDRQKSLFQIASEGDPEAPKGPFGGAVDKARDALAAALDHVEDMMSNLRMLVTPMAEGTDVSRRVATNYARMVRKAAYEWSRYDTWLQKTFKPERLKAMWEAADEHSVAIQQGADTAGIGLNRLNPAERAAVEHLQDYSRRLFAMAKRLGMVEGPGLPFYAPRYVVELAEGVAKRVSEPGKGVSTIPPAIGRALTKTSSRLMRRKHLTTEETEAAAAKKLETGAAVVRNVRTLALANRDLQRAIAGRVLINQVRRIGEQSGQLTVAEGGVPSDTPHGWFTIPHPAFYIRRPARFNMVDGKLEPVRDAEGHVVTMDVPLHVRGDFEGPLKAVLGRDTGKLYRGFMALKAKTMSVIMYSPLIHNAVEWGRALPAMPGKVATFQVYFEGNAARNGVPYEGMFNHILHYGMGGAGGTTGALAGGIAGGLTAGPVGIFGGALAGAVAGTKAGRALARAYQLERPMGIVAPQVSRAIDLGMAPLTRYGNVQDITSMVNEPSIAPGRSFTAKLIGAVPGLFDKDLGDAVKTKIDQFGDLWHNSLLWDRVADLQMGLFLNMEKQGIKKLAAAGITGPDAERAAGEWAAHNANRYAGALPIEAMSTGARQIANFMLFSRSFTLGNLGAMKDALGGTLTAPWNAAARLAGREELQSRAGGLPLNVQDMISKEAGDLLQKTTRNMAARKALAIIATDIVLFHVANAALQSAIAIMSGDSSLDKEGQGYARRFGNLLQHGKENPLDLLNPFADLTALQPQGDNEPGKQDRVFVGTSADGTAIYVRNPVGKIGEEMEGWTTRPLDMLRRKEGTIARPLGQTVMNDDGFGHPVYNPYDETPAGWIKNMVKIAGLFMGSQVPMQAIRAAQDYYAGRGDKQLQEGQMAGPLLGLQFSRGYPHGPAFGLAHRAEQELDIRLHEVMPDVVRKVQDGDPTAAYEMLTKARVPLDRARGIINSIQMPGGSLPLGRRRRNFEQSATPEQKAQMRAYEERIQQQGQK